MAKTHILVIEDEPRMRSNISMILKMEDYEVTEASNGREGIEICQQRIPDLVVCDVSMPEMDGHQTLQALKENRDTAQIPFIFLTAHGEHKEVRTGMNSGADDYLVKPFETDDLLNSIETRLKRIAELTSTKPTKEPTPKMLIPLGLTEREAETLFWLAQGKANSDLCILLDVKLTTIKKHLERIYQKLGVENRTSAAAMAHEFINKGE